MKIFGNEVAIPDFLADTLPDPIQRAIAYAIIYVMVGLALAYVWKTLLKIRKQKAMLNIISIIIAVLCVTLQEGIPEIGKAIVILGLFITNWVGFKLFPLKTAMVYVIESDKQNVIVEEFIFYHHGATLCVALQDNASIIKRIFLGRKVLVLINAVTNWKEDYENDLWLCNSYRIFEETLIEGMEEVEETLRAKIKNVFTSGKQVYLELDVCDAHEISRWDLIQRTIVLDMLVQKYEKLGVAYTKLRTMLTAMVIKKHSNVLLGALRTFEDAITITKEERAKIRGVQRQLEKEKEDIEAGKLDKGAKKPQAKQKEQPRPTEVE